MNFQTSSNPNIATKTAKVSRYFMVFFSLLVLFAGPLQAQPPEEELISFEGEVESTVDADYTEDTTDSETNFTAELDMEDNLTLDLDLTNEYESDGDSTWGAELDFEVTPALTTEDDMVFYLETDLVETGYNEGTVGLEGSLGETDYDIGVDLSEEDKELYLELYRRFNSGISLRGDVLLGNGPLFRTGQLSFRGVALKFNEVPWELSGDLEATLEKSTFGSDDRVKLSFDLENEKINTFRFPKKGSELSFYSLEPLKSGSYSVKLHNSRDESVDLAGWKISSAGGQAEIPANKIINPGAKLKIDIGAEMVEEAEELKLIAPSGDREDSWPLPRFYYGNDRLFRREGVLERGIEISFTDNEFDELTVEWDLEVPSGPESFYFADFAIDHTVEVDEAALGYEGPWAETEVSLVNKGIEIILLPTSRSEVIDSELGLVLDKGGEFETAFEIAQEFEGFELEHVVELSSEDEETEIELEQVLGWNQFQAELGYLYENSELSEFGVQVALEF
jgi:hypothetical protein